MIYWVVPLPDGVRLADGPGNELLGLGDRHAQSKDPRDNDDLSDVPAPVELSYRYRLQMLLDGVDDVARKRQVCLCGGPVLMKERHGFARRVEDKL